MASIKHNIITICHRNAPLVLLYVWAAWLCLEQVPFHQNLIALIVPLHFNLIADDIIALCVCLIIGDWFGKQSKWTEKDGPE